MNFQRQKLTLPISNFDNVIENSENNHKRHGDLLPSSIRAIICGPSNCGKTNALLTLLIEPNGLRYENVYVFSKSLNQPKYQFLKNLLDPLEYINYFSFNDCADVIPPDSVLPNSIMVFDDIACEKQDSVKAYFCMGRHKGVDSFYLCQSYTRTPKHLVRDNVNLIIVFRQDEMNLKHIYDDHVNTDMTFKKFRDICLECWNHDKYTFLVIDKDSKINSGRYRMNFDQYLINNNDC